MKYKFRWVEKIICIGYIDANTEEEAEDIFNNRIPDDAEQVDVLNFDGGIPFEILDIEEVIGGTK